MPRTKRVLVAVDESDASRRAVGFVDDFFASLDVELLAINVTVRLGERDVATLARAGTVVTRSPIGIVTES